LHPAKAEPELSSFEEVRARVYASPCPPGELPRYDGASNWETLQAIVLANVSERITAGMKRTLADGGDYKDSRVKLFHPKGVCASARWQVSVSTGYTGLFAAGTNVPAIVRMSASGNNTKATSSIPAMSLLNPRSFGLAVKLFPCSDPQRTVRTRNLLLFDQTGLDGNPSPWYMRGPRQGDGTFGEQYFLNWMHGSGPVSTGFERLFSRFASDVRYRSLQPLAEVDGAGLETPAGISPRFVRLIPSAWYPDDEKATRWGDFRSELLQLASQGPLAFEVAVSETNPVASAPPRKEMVIGRLTLDAPVVSEFGDRQLHFSHKT
jgi:hypothetical protein